MKQHIVPKQAMQLPEQQFYILFGIEVQRKDWANFHHKKVTVGKLVEAIRGFCHIDMYTTDKNWCIQLFNLEASQNELPSCIHETSEKELVDALFNSLLWVLQNNGTCLDRTKIKPFARLMSEFSEGVHPVPQEFYLRTGRLGKSVAGSFQMNNDTETREG